MSDDKKHRSTVQRKDVLNEIMGRYDHPSADDIYISLRSENSKLSRGTVYRNLNLLCDEGEIGYVRVPGADRFDSRADNHYHIICKKCGKVVDAPIDYVEEYDSRVEELCGFRIEKHSTIFEGICPDCIKKKNL